HFIAVENTGRLERKIKTPETKVLLEALLRIGAVCLCVEGHPLEAAGNTVSLERLKVQLVERELMIFGEIAHQRTLAVAGHGVRGPSECLHDDGLYALTHHPLHGGDLLGPDVRPV